MEQPPPQTPPIQTPSETVDGYEFVADKVGFVPNIRKSDNAYQAKFIATGAVFSAGFGGAYCATSDAAPWYGGLVIGLVIGLLVGLLVSGTILAVKNLKR